MFVRCRQMIKPGITKENIVNGSPVPVHAVAPVLIRCEIANTSDATIEDNDTMRLSSSTTEKLRKARPLHTGETSRTTPRAVATPLPPRNRSQIGYMWPTTAEIPAISRQ